MNAQDFSKRETVKGKGNPSKIKIIAYRHSPLPSGDPSPFNSNVFEDHLRMFEGWGYTTITLDDYRLFLAGVLNLPRRPLIITFDQADVDVYQYAFPALQEFGMRAVVFVSVQRSASPVGRKTAITDQQIVEMHAAGFEIGSNGMTGEESAFASRESAWAEVSKSRMQLEIIVNSPVRTFSYPGRTLQEGFRQLAADAGYSFVCMPGPGRKLIEDPFCVGRIPFTDTSMLKTMVLRFWLPSLVQ